MRVTTRLTRLLLAGACLSTIPIAAAQDAAPAEAVETTVTQETAQLGESSEEVTVTATRRATKIQATPIAITAVGEKALENAGVRETQSLIAVVPSLQFPQSESSGSVTARIRGVGTQGSNPGLESAVGIFIDGVYRSRNSTAFGDLGDIQRIEVLRGPQGTLFGRNTSAGLISVITKEPSLTETEFNASAGYESFEGYSITGGVTAPIQEGVSAVRLFGSYRKRDGYMDLNVGLPRERDGNLKESWNLRGQFLYKPSDLFSLKLIVDAGHKDDECCYAGVLRPGGPGRGGLASSTVANVINTILGYDGTARASTIEDQIGFADRDNPQIVDERGVSLEMNGNIGDGTLTSITAYRDWKLSGGSDADYTAADYLWTDGERGFQHFQTFTQEVRFSGTAGPVDYLVGAFYSNERLSRETTTLNGRDTEAFLSLYRLAASPFATRGVLANIPLLRPGSPAYAGGNTHALNTGLNDYYEQDADSIALFTHNVISITDQLKLTAGLRYTSETKSVQATYRTNSPAGCAYLESIYGLNPGGTSLLNPGGGGAPAAAVYCVPWGRSALDVLTASAPLEQEQTEEEFSGVATLAYEFSENFNAYATYSRGYKGGGFNLDRSYSVDNGTVAGSSIVRCPDGSDGSPAQRDLAGNIVVPANPYTCANPTTVVAPDLGFLPEFVDAYEIGAKGSFLDGSVTANLAIYYQEFENYQLNTFTGISFVVTSVPEVISQGVELDLAWFTPVDGLSFNAGLAYSSTKYGDDLGSLTERGSFLFENPNLFYLPGENLTSAPEWTLTGGVTYEFPVMGGEWIGLIHTDARYVSSQRTGSNLDPAKELDGYTIVNLRLGLTSEDERFGVELWAKNLFDERYYQITFDSPLAGSSPTAFNPNPVDYSQIGAFLAEPLTLGIKAKLRY